MSTERSFTQNSAPIKHCLRDQVQFVDFCERIYGEFATRDQIWGALINYLTSDDDRFFNEGRHRWGGGNISDRCIIFEILKENKE